MKEHEQKREITRAEIETILSTCIIAILIGGGAGVYFPLVMGKAISADSLATYVLAVLAPFWIDMLLPEAYWPKLLMKTRMKVGVGCAVAAVLATFALLRDGKSWDMTFASLGTVMVLIVWFYLAILSGRYKPEVPTQAPETLAVYLARLLNTDNTELVNKATGKSERKSPLYRSIFPAADSEKLFAVNDALPDSQVRISMATVRPGFHCIPFGLPTVPAKLLAKTSPAVLIAPRDPHPSAASQL